MSEVDDIGRERFGLPENPEMMDAGIELEPGFVPIPGAGPKMGLPAHMIAPGLRIDRNGNPVIIITMAAHDCPVCFVGGMDTNGARSMGQALIGLADKVEADASRQATEALNKIGKGSAA